MRSFCFLILMACLVIACDDERLYEKNVDFENEQWVVSEKPSFEFIITDTSAKYNLFCNIRNEVSYPKANIYLTYYLSDSTGRPLQSKLLSHYLFDKKTGKAFGDSGLGDIYDHQIPIARNVLFKNAGKYTVTYEQFMRMDTLPGMIALGLRVERLPAKED